MKEEIRIKSTLFTIYTFSLLFMQTGMFHPTLKDLAWDVACGE